MALPLSNQTSRDAVDFETIASFWAALQNDYEGTNIAKTVARLLHMYQPEDGILAYERLLRTLYVLLENFDSNGFRLLVSMVPSPKDVPESKIQEIFQKTLGFTRIASSVSQNHFVDSAKEVGFNGQINNMKVDPNSKDMIHCSRSFPINKGEGSGKFNTFPQTISSDPGKFIGLPSNEMCNPQTRVQKINQFYEPTSANYVSQAYHACNSSRKIQDQQNPTSSDTPIDYRMKRVYTPYSLRKNAICQSTQLDQDPRVVFQAPNQKHLNKSKSNKKSQVKNSKVNQFQGGEHSRSTQECLQNSKKPAFIDLSKDQGWKQEEILDLSSVTNTKNVHLQKNQKNSSGKMKKKKLSFETKIEEEREFNDEETSLLKEKVKLMQRAIQEDIFKMDVVQVNFVESNSTATSQTKNLEPEDLDVHDELEQSVQKFLQRVKTEEKVSAPVVPKPEVSNPTTEKTMSDETSAFIDSWKKIITRSVLGRDPQPSSADSDKNPDVLKGKTGTLIENGSKVKKETEKKVRKKKPKPPTRSKSERVVQKTLNRALIDEMENQPSCSRDSTKRMNKANSNKELILQEPNLCFQTKSCESNPINMLQQTNSMSEFDTFKNQYYDAMMSIQRAKVAVANSLAISSMGNATGYDPYYFNYLQQQQQLMEQQQQFFMGTQFSTQQPLHQPVVPNNQNASCSWANSNNWIYPSFGQFQFPQQPTPVYSTPINPSAFGFLAQDTTTAVDRQCGENQCDQSRPKKVKRKKLEEIVGKLKNLENVNTH